MALKTGILSDSAMRENCKDYSFLPVGFANSEFIGVMGNPYLPGIKTPKYQRSAPRPVSADVMAVEAARFMKGNRAVNARIILNNYQKEVKEYKPPRVSLAKIERDISDIYENANRQLIPSSSSGTTRGDLIHKQTIAINAEPTINIDRLISQYSVLSAQSQKNIGAKLKQTFKNEGINASDYNISFNILQGRAVQGTPTSEYKSASGVSRIAELKTVLTALASRGSNANLDEIFGILSEKTLGLEVRRQPSAGAGTSTEMSEAVTQQGLPEPAEPPTTPQVEKK
jgi:hypothetical protein